MSRSAVRTAVTVVVVSLAVAGLYAQGGGRGAGPGQGTGPAGRGLAPSRDATDQSATGTAILAGTVVLEGAGTPVRRARVNLSAGELRGSRSALTDDQGRFSFAALPAGRYTLNASKAGFVNIAYGAKRPGRQGTPVQLAEGQRLDRLTIAMPRGSVLTGVVVDEHGEPAAGVPVRALRAAMQTGERTWQVANQDTTDDRGMYRIYQLQPGDYMVSAAPRNTGPGGDMRELLASEISNLMAVSSTQGGAVSFGFSVEASPGNSGVEMRLTALREQLATLEQQGATAYAPVYFPGTTSPGGAQAIALGPGEERGGVDFRLLLVPTTEVRGIVTSATGALPPGAQVMLRAVDDNGVQIGGVGTSMARVDAQGRFEFERVTPGAYALMARANPAAIQFEGRGGRGRGGFNNPQVQSLWAQAELVVTGQPLPDIVLTLRDGMTVSGRVEYDGASRDAFDPSSMRVALTSRGSQAFQMGGLPTGTVDESGRFTITGVAPGRYALMTVPGGGRGGGRGIGRLGGPAAIGQHVPKSAMADGIDLFDFPVEIAPNQNIANVVITYTDRRQQLSGTIQDTSGGPTSDFTIIVFPSDRRYWMPQSRRIDATRPGTDGRFTFGNLPAGDYRLTAVTDVEPGEWYDPAFLEQLGAASIPVTLGEGEQKVQNIRLSGV